IGALLTPLLVSALGPRAAFAAIGAILPVLTLISWARISVIDAGSTVATEPLELLRAIPIFTPLPEPAIERLAAIAEQGPLEPGAAAWVQGDEGDRFYVVADGTAAVTVDGVETNRLARGDFFGEIALLRDVPRTATVTAVEPLRLFALERDDFIAAVTGYAPSREAADSIVAARLPAVATG